MKVNKALVSGCTSITRQTIAYNASEQKFAFLGDAHIFIYNAKGAYRLETVIPFCEKIQNETDDQTLMVNTDLWSEVYGAAQQLMQKVDKTLKQDIWGGVGVACLEWNIREEGSRKPSLLAAVTFKTTTLEIWDTDSGNFIKRIKFDQKIIKVSWSPTNEDQLLVVTSDRYCFVVNYQTGQSVTCGVPFITTAIWHPRQAGKLLLGLSYGGVVLYDLARNAHLMEYDACVSNSTADAAQGENDYSRKVLDICFSPGEDVFLVHQADGRIRLFGQEEPQPRMEFEKQQAGISKVQWLDNISGDFITASSKVGALRIFNAAQPAHKEMMKVSRYGILNVIPMQSHTFLLQLSSGQLTVFSTKTRKIRYTTEVGHTHQIQKCKISPQNADVLGSVGFDGTLRIWDLSKFQLLNIFEDRHSKGADRIIQSLAWCPIKPKPNEDDLSKYVVVVTSAGKIKLVDSARNKVLWHDQIDDDRVIFDVDWNTNGFLAIGATGPVALIKRFNRAEKKFDHYSEVQTHSSVRTVHFNPLKPNLLAVGCFNGSIILYDVDKSSITQVLKGSESRVVCVQWHPQFEYILATGSFDAVVRVFDTKYNGQKTLAFHTDRVRSLQWNSEFPWMLTSGADDSYIGVWDIRSKSLLFAVKEPSLALTAFATHPARPFTLYSSHFDASIMQWSMLGIPDVALAQIKFLLQADEADVLCNVHELMNNEIKAKVTGTVSSQVYEKNKKGSALSAAENTLRFFQGQDGQEEFWAMISILSGEGPRENSDQLRVNHIQDVTFSYQSKAQELIQAPAMQMLGTQLSKKEDRLQEAARTMLKSGNFQGYCDVQMELGNFEDAISVAPKISLKYWEKCLNAYKSHLSKQIDGQQQVQIGDKQADPIEEFVDYSILAGDIAGAARVLDSNRQTKAAKTVQYVELSGGYPSESVVQRHEVINNLGNVGVGNRVKSLDELGPDDKILTSFTDKQAQTKFEQREPLLAAAIHLSMNDVKAAIQKLLLSNTPEFAFVLAKEFHKESLDHVLTTLFAKTVFFEQMSITNCLLEQIKNPILKEILESTIYVNNQPDGDIQTNRTTAGPRQGSTVADHLISQNVEEAVRLANQNFRNSNSSGGPAAIISPQVFEDYYFLGLFDLINVGQSEYNQLVSNYRDLALIKALYWRLFGLFRWVLFNTESTCAQSPIYSALREHVNSTDEELMQLVQGPPFIAENLASFEKFLKKFMPSFVGDFEIDQFKFIDPLKKKSLTRDKASLKQSFISHKSISIHDSYMKLHHFDSAGAASESIISLEEALNLHLIIPFSPLSMTDREKFNPFQRYHEHRRESGELGEYI